MWTSLLEAIACNKSAAKLNSLAIPPKNLTSLARVPPANAPPGDKYALGPILLSLLSPLATSWAFAPTYSQNVAISFANAIEFGVKCIDSNLLDEIKNNVSK